MRDGFSDRDTVECPFDYYDELRENEPVFFSESLGAYVITRYADLQKISGDYKLFSSMSGMSHEFGDLNYSEFYQDIYKQKGVPVQVPTLVRTGGEVHRRYRSLVDRYFGPQAVKGLRPDLLAIIDDLIDGFIDRGEADIQSEFCLKLPLAIMCRLLGLPIEEAERLAASADAQTRLAMGAMESPEERLKLHEVQASFHGFLVDLFAERRRKPDDTILGDLLHRVPEGVEPPTDAELCSLISLMNIGGNETTTSGLSNMFYLCFNQEGYEDRLRDNRESIPKFVEEALRIESPVVAMLRYPVEDVEISGVHIPKGSALLLNYAAANRDERQFACPRDLNPDRKGVRTHVAFGAGIHYCLGASLARLELELAMNRFLDRMRDIRLANHGCPLTHQPKVGVRTLNTLPITFTKIA